MQSWFAEVKFEVQWCAATKKFENRFRNKYQSIKSNNAGATGMILHACFIKQQAFDIDLRIVYKETTAN